MNLLPNKKQLKLLALPFLASLLLLACNTKKDGSKDPDKVYVTSTFSIISQMTEEIGGDLVKIHNLVPIGKAPHNYDPKPNDIKFALETDLFLYNGLNLEGGDKGWFMRLIESQDISKDKVFEVAKEVKPMYLSDESGRQEINPHAFISPRVGILMAEAIRDALIAVDKEHEDIYQKSAAAYIGKIKTIEGEYKQKMAEIPPEDRVFVASEQAFQYLCKDYGLKEGHIWAVDTDENGSPKQIKETIAFVKENKPPVLFVESNVDIRPMETVSKATGIPIYSPAVYSDELGRPGETADTYLKYLEYNLKHIYHGLTGHSSWEE